MTDFITSRFRTAIDKLLHLEGGFVDHPADRGGPTKWGISQRSYPKLDIRNLTREVAADIYHVDFWNPLRCDKLWSRELAEELFEFGVNAGVKTAARALQVAINGLGRPLPADGRVGPATLAAANSIPGPDMLAAFRREIVHHYTRLARKDPSQRVFLEGWLKRVSA